MRYAWILTVLALSTPCFAQDEIDQASAYSKDDPLDVPVLNSRPMQGVTPGLVDRGGYSATNPPAQPQVAGSLCQYCGVAVDCADNCGSRQQSWRDLHPYNFGPLKQGEWLGPVRLPSAIDNPVRVGDQIRFLYILSREVVSDSYRLQVGDSVAIKSLTDENLQLGDVNTGIGVRIQPNGKLVLSLIGEQPAAGLTIKQLRRNLEIAYLKKIRNPAIDVFTIQTNTARDDLRDAVDARGGQGGQSVLSTVQPDGSVRLPRIGQVCVL